MKNIFLFTFSIALFGISVLQAQSDIHPCIFQDVRPISDDAQRSYSGLTCPPPPPDVVPEDWKDNFTPSELAGPHYVPYKAYVNSENGIPLVYSTRT